MSSLLGRGVRLRRRLVTRGVRQPTFQRDPGPLEGARHGLLGGFEHERDLTGAKAEHVAQYEHDALAWREELEGGHKGERDGLACLVARVRSGCGVGQALQEEVRIRLKPDHLTHLGRFGWVQGEDRVVHLRAAASGAERVQASARRDPVKPRAERGAFLEVAESPPRREQRLLERVLCVLGGAEDSVAVHVKLAPVRIGELGERLPIAGSSSDQ